MCIIYVSAHRSSFKTISTKGKLTFILVNTKVPCPQMTLSVCESACVDGINTNAQYNHRGTRACVVQVLPRPSAQFYLHHRLLWWDEAPTARQGCFSSPTSAVNLRQAIILLLTATCQSISTSETHTHTHIPSSSVAWLGFCLSDQVQTSELLSFSFLHKRMHNSLIYHTNIHSLHLCESHSHIHA